MTHTKRLAFVAMTTILVMLGIELSLRLLGAVLEWRASLKLAASAGEGPTVLAIGESTTGGLGVDPSHSYPQQLEALLRQHYANPEIDVVAPWAMGQNSSQQLNRIGGFLEAYRPRLVLFMCGVNNPWSFAESNITSFVDSNDPIIWRIRLRRVADHLRVVKLARMGMIDLKRMRDDLSGVPELEKWPPPSDVYEWSLKHRAEFLELWRSDVGGMLEIASRTGAGVALMTYPRYKFPPPEEFRALAAQHGVPCIDIYRAFEEYLETGRSEDVLLGDGYHPNRRGYTLLAEEVFRFIVVNDSLGLNSARPDDRGAHSSSP